MVMEKSSQTFSLSNKTERVEGQPTKIPTHSGYRFTLADSVAAVTIAVLATTVLITIVCIVRLLRKRRQQHHGQQMNQTPAVYASTIGANVMAFHNLHIQMQNDSDPSWEPVQVHQNLEVAPSTSGAIPSTSYSNDPEILVISINSAHNDIQRQQNHINAGYVADNTDEATT